MVQLIHYYLGRRKKEVPLLPDYSHINESNASSSDSAVRTATKPYFVGETKDGFAHGRGKLFNFPLKGSLCVYDAEWENGKIRSGKLYKNYGLYMQLIYKGELYEGDWEKGERHGKGTGYDKNGKKHCEGNFVNGRLHGKGILYHENGNKRYEGNFVNGFFHGKGIEYYENGNKWYEGNWENGRTHGYGTEYSYGKKRYEGNWENGKKQGKGILYRSYGNGYWYCSNYGDGNKEYEGDFENGECHGKGIEYSKDGNKNYEGEFEHGKRHGKGIWYRSYRKKLYEGDWENGKWHGKGIQYDERYSYKKYEGDFENGKWHGKGIEYYKNGNKKYEGDWETGKWHGKGTFYAEDGSIYQEGKFIRGQFFDEIGLMAQKYLETRDSSVLDEISTKEIQKYIETRFKMTIPDTETKAELLEQLILLSRPSEKHTIQDSQNEVKCDEFGNEIVTKCLGNDGNIYDIESMLYLFQKNERGDYMNISYHYADGQRRPNFPVMGNGKRLDGYQIVCEEEV